MREKTQSLNVYLPLRFNPDETGRRKKVPAKLIRQTQDELLNYLHEEGLSTRYVYRERIKGIWKGLIDEMLVVTIDSHLSARDLQWLERYAIKLKSRFQQEAIYLTYFDIYVILV